MRKISGFNRVGLLVMVLMLLFSMSFSVFAATSITLNPNDSPAIQKALGAAAVASDSKSDTVTDGTASSVVIMTKSNTTGSTTELELFSYATNVLTFNVDSFKTGKDKELRKVMQAFVDSLNESSITDDTQKEIMNEISNSDKSVSAIMLPMIMDNLDADLFTAYKILSPFLGVIRVLLGIGAVVIIALLMASTVFDLCYIGLPMWREQATEKNNGKKPFGVSHEALYTVQEVEKNLGEYKNAYLMYGKRRALTYVALSVCILYLVVGELGGLIGWLLSLGKGVM